MAGSGRALRLGLWTSFRDFLLFFVIVLLGGFLWFSAVVLFLLVLVVKLLNPSLLIYHILGDFGRRFPPVADFMSSPARRQRSHLRV